MKNPDAVSLLSDVAFSIADSGGVKELTRRCAESIARHVGESFVRFWLLDEAGKELHSAAYSGPVGTLSGTHAVLEVGSHGVGRIAREHRPQVTHHLSAASDLEDGEWALREGFAAFAGYPLIMQRRLVGVMAIFARRSLPAATVKILEALAPAIAVGIVHKQAESESARLLDEMRHVTANLERASGVKDQFLSMISHELRSPLTSVIGNGMLLLRHGPALSRGETEECLQDIVSGGERLQRTIENLLLLTRLEAGQTLDREPISLTNIVDESIEMFSKKNPNRQVEVEIAQDMPGAMGEGTLIALVLENLVSNADKYSPKDRPIRVSLERTEGEEVQVRVSDFGVGVAEEDMEYLFAPFYRSDWARNHAKGMGLGLAVSKRIMDAHNGRIWVECRPDGGSDFIFTLRSAAAVGV